LRYEQVGECGYPGPSSLRRRVAHAHMRMHAHIDIAGMTHMGVVAERGALRWARRYVICNAV